MTSTPPRTRRSAALFLLLLCSVLPGFGQAFLAEWTASANGGVGPTGMALATESGTTYLYVSDHPRNRIIKFNAATGAVVTTLGQAGNGNGQFSQPYGIAIEPTTGDLYVAERGNHRVQRITNTGTFVMAWGTQGTAAGQFNEPIGIALDAAGDIYVTEHTNHRVQKFRVAQSSGTWSATNVTAWGSQGSGNGQFDVPYGIAVDGSGNVLVADGRNGRVQRFSNSGTYQATIGAAGTAAGQFLVPTGVTLDSSGAVWVASTNTDPVNGGGDANNQWLSKFSAAGAFVSRFGGAFGTAQGQFRLPFSIVVGANNRAYVADYYNNRVQVFDLSAPAGGGGGGGGGSADTTAPTVASFSAGSGTATSVTFALTFSESVTGVDATDFTATTTGGATATVGAITGSGASYAIPVAVTGSGTVRLSLKTTGTAIADASGNAFSAGGTSTVFTIPGPGGGSGDPAGTRVTAVTVPANRTYEKNDELIFTVRFSGNVSVRGVDADDDDDDDGALYFTWTATGTDGGKNQSGQVRYKSGSGTNTLTFRYKVKNGDVAAKGITLGTSLQLSGGASLRDANGVIIAGPSLTLPWAANPLSGVIIDAEKSNNGSKGRDRLVNLSSRLRVTGGDASRSVVAGFVVTGAAPKPILIRAVGPGLAGFGVRDALAQPRLTLRDSTGKIIAEDDGWNDRLEISIAGDRVGAFRLGRGSRDAALIVALNPGAYSAQVSANGNGIVLLEVYDASSGTEIPSEQIVNISTRGFVGTDDDVLVAGFVVTGTGPRRVLVRGIGPGLTAFGVPGALSDPVLKLYRAGASAPVAQNDNWETPQPITAAQTPATAAELSTATTAAGAFPLAAGSKDAAIVVTLEPGSYSAIVSGAANGTGAGLVEVYELPTP